MLAGCAMFTKGSDEVRFDRMQVAIARGDMLALFAVLQTRATDRCSDTTVKARRFSPESCLVLQQGLSEAAALDRKLVEALLNPKIEVDWIEVVRVIKVLVALAMKFA
jgi:hypothetical protein